ncbi:hydratase [Cognatishimia sp. MH4019]|uniref:hydratase n=1 Tax=Cognatishimia sp. MH4019 TaxID=2854030 RepID=UPI001CD5E952|nr:hydratase [Cognatishimia sp. MH4019]
MTDLAHPAPQLTGTAFARALCEAHRTNTRFVPTGPVPGNSDEAFAAQAAVMEEFGPVGAFKVADKAGQPFVMAPIRADRIFESGADVPIIDEAGIELEVGFEVLSSLPEGADLATLVHHIWPRPVIEVVDTRIAGPLANDPYVKLADLQANSAIVVGPRATAWDRSDFGSMVAQLTCGDMHVLDGETMVPGGSALNILAKLTKRIGEHCGGLQPGQMIITGSLNGLPYFPAGQKVRGKIEMLGDVSLRLTR